MLALLIHVYSWLARIFLSLALAWITGRKIPYVLLRQILNFHRMYGRNMLRGATASSSHNEGRCTRRSDRSLGKL